MRPYHIGRAYSGRRRASLYVITISRSGPSAVFSLHRSARNLIGGIRGAMIGNRLPGIAGLRVLLNRGLTQQGASDSRTSGNTGTFRDKLLNIRCIFSILPGVLRRPARGALSTSSRTSF
jgi:hypothetical protein